MGHVVSCDAGAWFIWSLVLMLTMHMVLLHFMICHSKSAIDPTPQDQDDD
jgi:hypothetical protein